MHRRPLFVAIVLALLAAADRARAASPLADPYDLPDAPRPLSLPELTHPDIEWTTTTSVGAVSRERTAPELLERIGVELPFARRRLFVGAAYELGYGAPIARPGASTVAGGNGEVYVRSVWATQTGLAFGGGLGLLAPLATFARDGQGGDVALAAASLQPWDAAYFRSGVFTVRPFVDVRDLFGRFVFQFRESLDWSIETHDPSDRDLAAASMFYFGWLAHPLLGLGLEATEYYLIDAPVPDDRRAKLVVAPNLRFLTPGIQPALGAFVGLGSPLAPAADRVWGLRFALTFVWDPRKPFFRVLELME